MKVTKVTGLKRCSTHLLHQLHQLQRHIVKRISCLPPGLNELDESVDRCRMTCRGVGQRRCEIPKRRHFVGIFSKPIARRLKRRYRMKAILWIRRRILSVCSTPVHAAVPLLRRNETKEHQKSFECPLELEMIDDGNDQNSVDDTRPPRTT